MWSVHNPSNADWRTSSVLLFLNIFFFFSNFCFCFFLSIPFSFPQLAYPDSLLPIGRNPDPGNELTRGASMEWGRCLNTPDVSKTVERGIWGLPMAWSRKRKRKKETKEKS
ncbi:hypothetical protein BDQ94DRAFT_89307 [Aspergillus welwitschiae]|uniref:Uncharacterized protein n=1 Tax=Aspergillus welwitschiae TaxID=1341132 RepID=A0A3F3QE31_9EURO|nr:hypothetical protein BDQ94DRAFT_89307 [Aspergillus welwitschiae]RDH37355.1 hypothetical protein BDQ94DRAFT_89307 [Aspergillus welwitschiae]